MAAGFVSVPVIPTFKGMSKEFAERLEKPAKASGERAGKAMSEGMESAVENLERQVKASSSKLQDLDRAYEKSASKQAAQKEKLEAATLKLQDAEDKYQAALEKGDKGVAELAKVKEAKARVIGETEKLKQAEIDVRVAEQKHQDQLNDLNSTLAKLQDSQSDLNRELEKSGGAFGSAKDRIQSMADSAKNGAAKFGEFAQKYKFHASAALGGIGMLGKGAAEYASEAEQSYGAVESIFHEHADQINNASKKAAESIGISAHAFREQSAYMGAMLKNQGVPMDELADKTQELMGLGADLAATYGGKTSDAIEALGAMLRGETDPMEKYGVAIKEADIKARMAADGLDKLEGEAEKQARTQTLLKLAFEQTADAQGQSQREFETSAARAQRAQAAMDDMRESVGSLLLPVMGKLAGVMQSVSEQAAKHPKVLLAVAGAVATLSAAIVGAATIAPILTAWSAAATAAGTSMMGLAASTVAAIAPVAAVVAAVGAVGVALWAFFTKTEVGRDLWDKFVDALKAGWDWISGVFATGWDWLADKIGGFFGWFSDAWNGLWDLFVNRDYTAVLKDVFGWDEDSAAVDYIFRVRDAFTGLMDKVSYVKSTVVSAWDEMVSAFKGGDDGYVGLSRIVGDDKAEWILQKLDEVGDALSKLPDLASGVWDILFKGDYTGLPFGLEEDSGVVDFLFDVREAVQGLWDFLQEKRDQLVALLQPVVQFMAGAMRDVISSLGDIFKSLWDSLKSVGESLGSALGSVAVSLFESLVSVIQSLWKAFQSLWEAVKPIGEFFINLLLPVLKVVGAVIGGVVVGAVFLLVEALKIVAEVLAWVAEKFAWLMENILGPFIEILGQVAAFIIDTVVSAFTWLAEKVVAVFTTVLEWIGTFLTFLQENFWPVVEAIMGFVGDAFTALWDGLSWAWENIIQPVFNGILELAKITIGVIATIILAPLLIAWNLLSSAIQWAWENVIQPVWQALSDFAMNTLWPALQSVFQWIGDAWQLLSDTFSAIWGWIRDVVLQPMVDFFQNVLWPAIQSVIDWIVDKWDWLSSILSTVWGWIRDNVIQPMIDGFHRIWDAVSAVAGWISDKWNWLYGVLLNIWNWLNENVIQRQIRGFHRIWEAVLSVAGWIADKWQWMADRLHAGWVWVDQNVFGPFRHGLDVLKGWFRSTVDNIGRIWDEIKGKTKAPVQFVVDVVYNGGIRKAWNAVAGLVGLDKLQEIKFATGGILPGYTPGRDPYTFVEPRTGMRIGLSGGEAIMRPEATRVLGSSWVDGVNAAARVGGEQGVEEYLYGDEKKRSLGGFYSGGVIGSITDWVHKYYPMMTITSTLRNSNDYHGQGLAVDFSNSTDTTPQMQSAAQNLYSNYGKGLLELIHSPFNNNVKHGQNVGDGFGFYGAATMNQHRNHVHVASQQPLGDPKNMVEMVWDGAMAVFRSIRERVTDLFNPIIDKVKGKISDFKAPGIIGGLPEAYFKKLWGAAKEFILGKADEASNYSGAGGTSGNAESWREMAMAAMRRQGFNADDPAQVNAMIAQIQSESGGDPNIGQQIVDINGTGDAAGVGLLQIIPGTFESHRDPELANDRRDPWANMNAALRYYKSRYGTDLTTMWGHGHGYASGGVVELPKLYDQGGWLPHGGFAQNLSGKPEPVFTASQWSSLSEMIRTLGDLVPAIKGQTDVIAKAVDDAQAWLAKAGDYNSIEGINARQGARRVLDLGLELPGSDIIKMVLDGEDTLWESRARAAKNLDTIVEKEKALEDARKAVADLNDKPEGVSEDDQKKIDEAQKALDDAKAEKAKADSDDARAKAADKVTEAEKKLKDVREEVDKNSEENAKKHAEEVTKANEAVSKAEQELVAARKQQAMDLDNIVLVSQQQVTGLIPMAEKFADQLVSLGAPAAAVGAGLAQVTGGLSAVAAFIGPAGLTLGMALDMLKVAISLVKAIVDAIKKLVADIRKARLDALKALSDGWSIGADYAKLVVDLQSRVTTLQQALIRGANEQREAEYNLMLAQHDRYIAEAEGALKVAEARLALDEEIRRGAVAAQLKMMGLHEDWDSYMAYQALAAQGVLEEWSDTAISALFTYEKARAEALKGEVSARLDQIKAEAALAEAQRQNVRNQQDLLKAQERLIRMSAQVAGVELEDATGTAEIAKLMAEMAEVKQAMDQNTLGRWGAAMGAQGSRANEYRGQKAHYDALQQSLYAVAGATGANIDQGNLDRTLKLMGRAAYRGGDPMDVLRARMPELAQAEMALRVNEALKPVYDARDQRDDLARKVEDFTTEIDLYEQTTPLENTLKGLDYTIKSLEQSSEAWADGNEELRGEYLAAAKANRDAAEAAGVDWKLDSTYANAGVRDQIRRETTIHLDGEKMYTADQIDQLLAEVTAGTNGSYRIVRSASDVAVSRRKELV